LEGVKGRDHLEDLGVDGRVIGVLKLMKKIGWKGVP
jgi:hypothetical protein